jgi:L,D-peptidoglycan transpeptidase YkuD (ErfK/YbiS/YcfS/YnhG family)
VLKDQAIRKGLTAALPRNTYRPSLDLTKKPAEITALRVMPLPGHKARGRLHCGTLTLACALGPSGIKHRKREGDGATPAGRFRLIEARVRADKGPRPRLLIAHKVLHRHDGWCDDPASGQYNRAVRLPYPASHESLWRNDDLYDIVIILDHNRVPRIRRHGSAIFLHIAKQQYTPTAGCVALSRDALRRLLPRLARHVTVTIG